MKEVYVLHGRTDWNEDVFDPDGNYFEESPCVEVYDSFDEAKARLRELAIEAYNSLKKNGAGWIVDDNFVDQTTEEDLFSDYNINRPGWYTQEELNELKNKKSKEVMWKKVRHDLAWQYDEWKDSIRWQMYRMNSDKIDDPDPILPGLKIIKCVVNSSGDKE